MSSYPKACFTILISLELAYVAFTLTAYISNRHLKSFLFIIPRMTQSIFLLLISAVLLISYVRLEEWYFPISEGAQQAVSKILFISNLVEYALMLLSLGIIVGLFFMERKLKKTDEKYRKYVEQKKSFLIFKEKTSA
jgi:hypothetical protein